MSPNPTRRRVLQLTGVGATASIAGCSDLNVLSSSNDELEVGNEPDIDPADGITAVVQPPEEEIMEIEQEVMADIEAGEIPQEEGQLEIQERQTDLVMDAAIAFESDFADDDEFSIEAGIGEQGAFLLDGADERLMALLRDGDVEGLLPGSQYEQALEAQEAQEAQEEMPEEGAPEPEPEPDEEPDEDESDDDSDDESGDDSDDGSDGETDDESDDEN